MSFFVDAHAHLSSPEFDADREQVIARARAAGIALILDVALSGPEPTFEKALRIAEAHEGVYVALGVHPHDAKTYTAALEDQLLQWMAHPKVIAWGEIGLDFHYDHSPREQQRDVFRRQLELAVERHMPVVIHSREAEVETMEILETYAGRARGLMHCFTGSLAMARRCVDVGFFVSFSGILTFPKAMALAEVARALPRERILIETDCPYLAPIPYRGRRNEPLLVREVARRLAELWGESVETVARVTAENFCALFGRGLCRVPPDERPAS